MKRKTNLFYNTNEDTNFVTFSNYTESMTGNYLSTNTKIFPSRFLCLNIPSLDIEDEDMDVSTRQDFISSYLCGLYENKLATLRDDCLTYNYSCEDKITPLNYLIDAIYKYDPNTYISFVGEITEQDYNGIYADTICTINLSNTVTGTPQFKTTYNTNIVTVSEHISRLHGWENTRLPNEYLISPIYDDVLTETTYSTYMLDISEGLTSYNTYTYYVSYVGIYNYDSELEDIVLKNEPSISYITFNTVIPLYDTVNINLNNNVTITSNNIDRLVLTDNISDMYYKNVPMGMWFSDYPVELRRLEGNTNYAPSWSLVLSSQFKPFPYSKQIPDEITTNSTADAYNTFSQILIRQNKVLDTFDDVLNTLNNLSARVSAIEGQLNTTGNSYSLDNLNIEMINWESAMTKKYNELADNVNTYMSNLTWKYRQG